MAWTNDDTDRTAILKNITVTDNTVSGNFNLVIAWKTGTGTVTIQDLTINNNTLTANNPKASNYAVDLADVGGDSSFSSNLLR